MSTQIIVDNTASHKLHLIRHHHKNVIECKSGCEYSLSLPLSGKHKTLYKLKKDGHDVAYMWISKNGLVTDVGSLSEHFRVSISNKHHAQRPMIHGFGRNGLDVGDWIDGHINAVYSEGNLQVLLIRDAHC